MNEPTEKPKITAKYPGPGWSIRPATPDDLSDLQRLDSTGRTEAWSTTQFQSELEKPYSKIWLFTDDETDEIRAGFIVFWLISGEGQILNVVVDPSRRRQGFARVLVRRAVDDLFKQGAKKVLLEVRKSNTAAIGLYQSVGFLVIQVRKGFYSDGEDAYTMMVTADAGAEVIQF